MRYRIGMLNVGDMFNDDAPTIIYDRLEDKATVKSILRNLRNQSIVPYTRNLYFVDVLGEDGWVSVSEYWANLEREAMEDLFDAGKIDEWTLNEYMDGGSMYLLYPEQYFGSYADYQNA